MSVWTFSPIFVWVCGILITLGEAISLIFRNWHNKWSTTDTNSEIWKKKNLYIAEIYNQYISPSIEKILSDYFIYYSQNKFRFTPFYNFIKSLSKLVNEIDKINSNSRKKNDMEKNLEEKIKEFPFEISIGELELGKEELTNLKLGSKFIFYPDKGVKYLKWLYISCQIFTIIILISSILISRYTNPDNIIDSFLCFVVGFIVILFIILTVLFLKYYMPYKKIVKNYKKRIKIPGIV